jgi:hypothetical protein
MRDDEAEAYASMASTEGDRRNLSWAAAGAESGAAAARQPKPEALRLMEAVVERSNMFMAYERVVKNQGAPGVDGLTVSEFKPWLQGHWARVRQDLLSIEPGNVARDAWGAWGRSVYLFQPALGRAALLCKAWRLRTVAGN